MNLIPFAAGLCRKTIATVRVGKGKLDRVYKRMKAHIAIYNDIKTAKENISLNAIASSGDLYSALWCATFAFPKAVKGHRRIWFKFMMVFIKS